MVSKDEVARAGELIERGGDPFAKPMEFLKSQKTALMLSVIKSENGLVALMLSSKFCHQSAKISNTATGIESVDEEGNTALHHAVKIETYVQVFYVSFFCWCLFR